MKYFGKKSLSSVMSVVLRVLWYVTLLATILAPFLAALIIYLATFNGEPGSPGNIVCDPTSDMSAADAKDWTMFSELPFAVKFLILPYFGSFLILLLAIIKKARLLFGNFRNDIVFNKSNVTIISKISKLTIVIAVLSLSITSFLIGIVLLLLCEIVKSGTTLQEEMDFTV